METYFEKLNRIFDEGDSFNTNRLVVKVGSSTVMSAGGEINQDLLNGLASQTATLMNRGYQVAIVTSGAVACGRRRLGTLNDGLIGKQVLATVGQRFLENAWGTAFDRCGLLTGYSLLSENDLSDLDEHHEWPLLKALENRIVPILNANDAVNRLEIEQLSISADNDRLAGFVARRIQAGVLILLTEADGVWDREYHVIPEITRPQDLERIMISGKSDTGTGGIESKVDVAVSFARNGRLAFIANGQQYEILTDIIAGRHNCGTRIRMR